MDLAAEVPEDHYVCNGLKCCTRCEKVKPAKRFKHGRCRECVREVAAARAREMFKDPAFRVAKRHASKMYRVYGPQKRNGKVEKPKPTERTCRDCNTTHPIEEFHIYGRWHRRCRKCFRVAASASTRKWRHSDEDCYLDKETAA